MKTIMEELEENLDNDGWATGDTTELFPRNRDNDNDLEFTLRATLSNAFDNSSMLGDNDVSRLLSLNKLKKSVEKSLSIIEELIENIREYSPDEDIQNFRKTR